MRGRWMAVLVLLLMLTTTPAVACGAETYGADISLGPGEWWLYVLDIPGPGTVTMTGALATDPAYDPPEMALNRNVGCADMTVETMQLASAPRTLAVPVDAGRYYVQVSRRNTSVYKHADDPIFKVPGHVHVAFDPD